MAPPEPAELPVSASLWLMPDGIKWQACICEDWMCQTVLRPVVACLNWLKNEAWRHGVRAGMAQARVSHLPGDGKIRLVVYTRGVHRQSADCVKLWQLLVQHESCRAGSLWSGIDCLD